MTADTASGPRSAAGGDATGGSGASARARRPLLVPRRSVVAPLYLMATTWLLPVHLLGGQPIFGSICRTLGGCLVRVLVLWPVTVLFGLPTTYVIAAAVTAFLERRTGVVESLPSVFSPPDGVHRVLVGLGGLSLVTLLAGGYGAIFTPIGVALVYTLHYPLFAAMMLGPALPTPDGPARWLLVVPVYLAAVAGEVAWLYLLAYGLDRARTLAATARRRVAGGV